MCRPVENHTAPTYTQPVINAIPEMKVMGRLTIIASRHTEEEVAIDV